MLKFIQKLNSARLYPIRQRVAGFTLIEILVVVAILGVISVMSFPFYSRLISQNNVSDTVNNLVETLRKAQSYSLAGKDGSDWGVKYSNSSFVLLRESTNTTFDTYNLPTTINLTGLNHIVFSRPTGLPNVTGTFNISGGNETKSVTLNYEGVASAP